MLYVTKIISSQKQTYKNNKETKTPFFLLKISRYFICWCPLNEYIYLLFLPRKTLKYMYLEKSSLCRRKNRLARYLLKWQTRLWIRGSALFEELFTIGLYYSRNQSNQRKLRALSSPPSNSQRFFFHTWWAAGARLITYLTMINLRHAGNSHLSDKVLTISLLSRYVGHTWNDWQDSKHN